MEEGSELVSVRSASAALRASSRGGLIASLAAATALPITYGLSRAGLAADVRSSLACVLLLGLSFAVGSAAARRADLRSLPAHLAGPATARMGAYLGLLVFFIGGGFQLLAGVLPGAASGGTLLPVLGCLLTALPCVAVGSLAAGLTALPPRPVLPRPQTGPAADAPGGRAPLAASAALFALCVGISTAFPAAKADAESRTTVMVEPSHAADFTHREVQQEEPAYLPPAGLGEAPAESWTVARTYEVSHLRQGAPASVSPDGTLLAFADDERGLHILHLAIGSQAALGPPVPRVDRLSWSPDSSRVFCECGQGQAGRSFWVVWANGSSAVRLPVRGTVPRGEPAWTGEREVAFLSSGEPAFLLDLDSLAVRAAGDADLARHRGRRPMGRTATLPGTARCQLAIRPRLKALSPPLESESREWMFAADAFLGALDLKTGHFSPLTGPIERGTFILAPSDGWCAVLVSSRGARVCLFGLQEPQGNFLAASAPPLPPAEELPALWRAHAEGRIGVFVCAPLTNPLTGAVVGPDPSAVIALALLEEPQEEPQEGTARLRVIERYSAQRPDAVAGFLHTWEDASPVQLQGDGIELWWSQAGEPAPPHPEAETHAPRRWQDALLEPAAGAAAFTGWKTGGTGTARKEWDLRLRGRSAERPAAGKLPEDSGEGAPRREPRQAAVERFVREHHRMAGDKDLEGYMSGYADTVDYYSRGLVARDKVRADQAAYLPKYSVLRETVDGPVSVSSRPGGWRASYRLRSYAVAADDGKVFDRTLRLTLDMEEAAGGRLRIVRERAAAAE